MGTPRDISFATPLDAAEHGSTIARDGDHAAVRWLLCLLSALDSGYKRGLQLLADCWLRVSRLTRSLSLGSRRPSSRPRDEDPQPRPPGPPATAHALAAPAVSGSRHIA